MPLDASIPLVLTIHDLSFLRQKTALTIKRRLWCLQAKVNRATVITTASRHAAGEIRDHLDLRGKRIEIIPHGVCVNKDELVDHRPGFLPRGDFLFSLGDITPKKNVHMLVELAARVPEYRIVIAGQKRDAYAASIERRIREAGLEKRVLLPGPVSDRDRLWLYKNCAGFLFPSLSEGFGLPVIEAMACGRPVFISDLTSLPEVGGALAFYWRTFDPDSMAAVVREGMDRFSSDAGYADRLRQHASKFTWRSAADQYLALYRETLRSRESRVQSREPAAEPQALTSGAL